MKAFLKSGIMTELGNFENTDTGTPQGGILSPLLANVALSVLDEHFDTQWRSWTRRHRITRRSKGLGTWRLVRYAADFTVGVNGTRNNVAQVRAEVSAVLEPMGLSLSESQHQHVTIPHVF